MGGCWARPTELSQQALRTFRNNPTVGYFSFMWNKKILLAFSESFWSTTVDTLSLEKAEERQRREKPAEAPFSAD
jgi:hypothetical protein